MTVGHVPGSRAWHAEKTENLYPPVVPCDCGKLCDLRNDGNQCWGRVEAYPRTPGKVDDKFTHYCQGHKYAIAGRPWRAPKEIENE